MKLTYQWRIQEMTNGGTHVCILKLQRAVARSLGGLESSPLWKILEDTSSEIDPGAI